ncbi:MAG: hypothetical protein FRX48_00277 [Lasallia pustulata]|uniref:Uncharacterized protein n=1 Tax=Lasallia pustulata TaxID=136370 RepID=A0A5M8Q3H5_9LECA|nr:MAG: hypothetical protein FRX48_00277 [Lasallia pustulata]
MAPILGAQRRTPNTRGRGGRRPRPRPTSVEASAVSEPPPKKRRYVPGGPGGGGRYVDVDGTEIPVGGTGPGGYNYVGPRGRIGRENAANGVQPVTYSRPRRESRRERPATRPRYSSAAAAAAAVVQGDGFKPREERSWEEFHQDLDIETKFPVFSAAEVDGTVKQPATPCGKDRDNHTQGTPAPGGSTGRSAVEECPATVDTPQGKGEFAATPHKDANGLDIGESITPAPIISMKRRPGRPPRRLDSMLKGIGTPDTPKSVPLPGPNPREKLTLPKPSFRPADPFASFEQKGAGQLNYVDRTMANVGYQESDIYIRPEKRLIRVTEGTIEEDLDIGPSVKSDGETNAAIGSVGVGRVEYDMDEQDSKWLEAYNAQRKAEQVEAIKPAVFEITMTKIEKEWHALEKRIPKPNPKPPQTHRPRSSSAAAVNGEQSGAGEEQDSKCAICDDGDCENTNAIVFCDGCDLAVHQECYGVPFIPEGQWLCRKCQLIGRGTPTCIFCPNTDGAFKQTNASRWSHLLCAIWIPEVTLGNTTFMEPVMDVEKVPKQRWKLTCYICRQKMGACIQCGNKNCFVAFHVTCARRAKLFLKMKSTHGGPANLDASVLKAYCDKHVPSEWRRENDVETATIDAMEYYHYTMRGRLWADSQQSALTMVPVHTNTAPEHGEEDSHPKINLVVGGNKRKRNSTPKTVWRLPSGAPVIPQAVYNSVESSLQRFTIRKRKEYAAEACKYWTLKREARRGAALLKRLQLQMETFSSMEITRRNFVGMGAAGKVRLQRRIDFAQTLQEDVEKLRVLCGEIREREREKLKDADMLRSIVDTVYFPIVPLLWPILEKAQALDGKGCFREGFNKLRDRLEERFYTSVSTFSADLGAVFSAAIGFPAVADTAEGKTQIDGVVPSKDVTAVYKEKRKLAKRIVKAVQGSLEDAMRKESELCRKPFEKELRDLDRLLETSISSRRDSLSNSLGEDPSDEEAHGQLPLTNGATHHLIHKHEDGLSTEHAFTNGHIGVEHGAESAMETAHAFEFNGSASMHDHEIANESMGLAEKGDPVPVPASDFHQQPTPEDSVAILGSNGMTIYEHQPDGAAMASMMGSGQKVAKHSEPPTPPLSSRGELQAPLSQGGIPWYMDPFDPMGTTIHDERWTGREVVRGMSEELSDMDEEELSGLVDVDMTETAEDLGDGTLHPESGIAAITRRKNGVKRRRWRGYR